MALVAVGTAFLGQFENFPVAPRKGFVPLIIGKMHEFPRLVPLWLRKLVESVPLFVQLIWKLLLVLAASCCRKNLKAATTSSLVTSYPAKAYTRP